MKQFIGFIFFLLVIFSCQKEQQQGLTINGEVKGMTKGFLHLEKIVDTSFVLVDTFRVAQNGKFIFHDTLKSPQVYFISIREYPNDKITVFAEPGTINLSTKLHRFSSFAKVEGSENQILLEEFNDIKTKFNNDNLALLKEKLMAQKANNKPQVDSIQEVIDQQLKRRYLYTTNFAVKHADKDVAPYLALTELYMANTYLLDTIANSLNETTKNSHYGVKFLTFLKEVKEAEEKLQQ